MPAARHFVATWCAETSMGRVECIFQVRSPALLPAP